MHFEQNNLTSSIGKSEYNKISKEIYKSSNNDEKIKVLEQNITMKDELYYSDNEILDNSSSSSSHSKQIPISKTSRENSKSSLSSDDNIQKKISRTKDNSHTCNKLEFWGSKYFYLLQGDTQNIKKDLNINIKEPCNQDKDLRLTSKNVNKDETLQNETNQTKPSILSEFIKDTIDYVYDKSNISNLFKRQASKEEKSNSELTDISKLQDNCDKQDSDTLNDFKFSSVTDNQDDGAMIITDDTQKFIIRPGITKELRDYTCSHCSSQFRHYVGIFRSIEIVTATGKERGKRYYPICSECEAKGLKPMTRFGQLRGTRGGKNVQKYKAYKLAKERALVEKSLHSNVTSEQMENKDDNITQLKKDKKQISKTKKDVICKANEQIKKTTTKNKNTKTNHKLKEPSQENYLDNKSVNKDKSLTLDPLVKNNSWCTNSDLKHLPYREKNLDKEIDNKHINEIRSIKLSDDNNNVNIDYLNKRATNHRSIHNEYIKKSSSNTNLGEFSNQPHYKSELLNPKLSNINLFNHREEQLRRYDIRYMNEFEPPLISQNNQHTCSPRNLNILPNYHHTNTGLLNNSRYISPYINQNDMAWEEQYYHQYHIGINKQPELPFYSSATYNSCYPGDEQYIGERWTAQPRLDTDDLNRLTDVYTMVPHQRGLVDMRGLNTPVLESSLNSCYTSSSSDQLNSRYDFKDLYRAYSNKSLWQDYTGLFSTKTDLELSMDSHTISQNMRRFSDNPSAISCDNSQTMLNQSNDLNEISNHLDPHRSKSCSGDTWSNILLSQYNPRDWINPSQRDPFLDYVHSQSGTQKSLNRVFSSYDDLADGTNFSLSDLDNSLEKRPSESPNYSVPLWGSQKDSSEVVNINPELAQLAKDFSISMASEISELTTTSKTKENIKQQGSTCFNPVESVFADHHSS